MSHEASAIIAGAEHYRDFLQILSIFFWFLFICFVEAQQQTGPTSSWHPQVTLSGRGLQGLASGFEPRTFFEIPVLSHHPWGIVETFSHLAQVKSVRCPVVTTCQRDLGIQSFANFVLELSQTNLEDCLERGQAKIASAANQLDIVGFAARSNQTSCLGGIYVIIRSGTKRVYWLCPYKVETKRHW